MLDFFSSIKCNFSATVNTTSATSGRLNHPSDAWCFNLAGLDPQSGKNVIFSVDLGEPHLISGFQSQGPPKRRHDEDYYHYVGLQFQTSDNGRRWRDCCRNNKLVRLTRLTAS